jgi:hypothetical protein
LPRGSSYLTPIHQPSLNSVLPNNKNMTLYYHIQIKKYIFNRKETRFIDKIKIDFISTSGYYQPTYKIVALRVG